MACRVAQSPAVKLWMTSPSICKQVALERWGGVWAWGHVSMSVLAEEARCWRIQMAAVALKQVRGWSYCSPFKDSPRSVVRTTVCCIAGQYRGRA
jgi:hypothetical protein